MSKTTKKDLGDRMKRYEAVTEQQLLPRTPVLFRLDGHCFHTWTKGLKRPYDNNLRDCMEYAAAKTCAAISGARFAYTQSDEITILVIDYRSINTEGWLDYRVNKMVSLSAVKCSNAFNEKAKELLPEHFAKKGPAEFDSRVWNHPPEDVVNNFIWRQRDCEKNSISSLAQAYFSHKELLNKNSSDKQDMLMTTHGVNWNKVETRNKRGTSIYRVLMKVENPMNPKEEVLRSKWVADHEIPIFSKNPDFVENWLDPEYSVTLTGPDDRIRFI